MERTDRTKIDKTQVTPEPSRPDLFNYLEQLFDGNDQKPERIELRQAYGPGARKYGTQIVQKEYKVNQPKPSREQIVALSNELLDLAQNNCDALGKAHKYGILAKHYAKSDTYYACHVLAMRPKQAIAADGDDEEFANDVYRRDQLLQYGLDHIKQSDENERWRQDQHSTTVGDLIDRYQGLVQMVLKQNSDITAAMLEMQREHRELFKTADEALSSKAERELAAEMQKFKLGMMQDGFSFLKQMMPVAVNQITGKQTIPTDKSAESIAIASFLEGLSETQARALFGDMDENERTLLRNGIFTPEQAQIFWGVANCASPPAALDRLLDGEHAVTPDQLAKAQNVISAQQFMPLVALVVTRKRPAGTALPEPAPAPVTAEG